MFISLTALWWRRIRGLWMLPDGRDWLGGNWVLLWWARPCSVNLESNFLLIGGAVFPPCYFTQFSSVQSLSPVQLFPTPWTVARQASLSLTNSWSLFKLISIESVMPSNHLILCHPLLLLPSIFPSIRVFSNESVLTSGGHNIGVAASASVLPMNIQDWFPLGWTGWISLQSKGLSRVFSTP